MSWAAPGERRPRAEWPAVCTGADRLLSDVSGASQARAVLAVLWLEGACLLLVAFRPPTPNSQKSLPASIFLWAAR